MRYYSLNRKSPDVDFAKATRLGQAPDGGLYFPEHIPKLSDDFFKNLKSRENTEIGMHVMKPFVADSMPDDVLEKVLRETLCFDFPIVKISESIYALELFHGPTLAFKDVGARFMSRCLGYFNRNGNKEITVLVATSGDTGGAVANGFLGGHSTGTHDGSQGKVHCCKECGGIDANGLIREKCLHFVCCFCFVIYCLLFEFMENSRF